MKWRSLTKIPGPAFRGIKGKLYPSVGVSTELPGATFTANFGSQPFKYENWEDPNNTMEQSPKISRSRVITDDSHGENDADQAGSNSDADLEWE